jgi:hypothetical protein
LLVFIKEDFMKNIFCAVVIASLCSTVFANDCSNGTCRKPVRTAAVAVVKATERVVTAPVRVTKRFVSNSRTRRFN